MTRQIFIYDTTLRDGSQGEGINFSSSDKIRLAKSLADFGVHYIEGGWPGSNEKDLEFFEKAQKINWGKTKIAAFGSTCKVGIAAKDDAQVQLLLKAKTPVVTFFGKTWLLHIHKVLKTTPEENLRMIADTTRVLKKAGREVVYDAEHFFDGYFDNRDYAIQTLKAAEEAGADVVVLCDTNGGRLPHEVAQATHDVMTQVRCQVGIHTHNDCGLGVANAVASVQAGACHIQGTINGYGERVGNCNLTTVIPIVELKLKHKALPKNKLAELTEMSRFTDELANQNHDPRAPFVGITSFAHKGGMHVNAVNKVAEGYEHINPALVGNQQRILVGELSGKTNVMMKAKNLGIHLEEKSETTKEILTDIKALENKGYEFEAADASFELLIRKHQKSFKPSFEIVEYHTTSRTNLKHEYEMCEATTKVLVKDKLIHTVSSGSGPIAALDSALRRALVKVYPAIEKMHLFDYKVRIINSTAGTDAITRVLIKSTDGQSEWTTVGASTSIMHASMHALTDSIEYFLLKRK